MAGFRKAKAEQAALKLGLYGEAGRGKTFTALLFAEGLAKLSGKRVAYLDTEHGTDFYCKAVAQRGVHPDAFDFDAMYTRSLTEVLQAVKGLDPQQHCVVVIDSITHLWEAAMAAYQGQLTKANTIPMHAWARIKKPYKELMKILLESPMHVIICGRQKTVYGEDDTTGELKAEGVTMRAEGETPYEPHILIRLELDRHKGSEVSKVVAFAEKDRTGVLAGRTFVNPTFDSVCKPLLPLLGDTQAKILGGDEAAAVDAENLSQQENQREERSANILREYKAKIDLAKDSKSLKAISKDITPELKSKMLPAHVAELREHYQHRDAQLEGKVAVA